MINSFRSLLVQAALWERFVFHAIRSCLILYCIHGLTYSVTYAYHICTSFIALSYVAPIIGGLIADRFLGYSRSLIIGAITMNIGTFCLLVLPHIFIGLACIVMGSGFYRPNMATLFGSLAPHTKVANFSYYVTASNIGVLLAPLLCTMVGEIYGWSVSLLILFILSFVVTFLSCKVHQKLNSQFVVQRNSQSQVLLVTIFSLLVLAGYYIIIRDYYYVDYMMYSFSGMLIVGGVYTYIKNKKYRNLLLTGMLLMLFNILFWTMYDQTSSTINLFTHEYVDKNLESYWSDIPFLKGIKLPTTFFQAIKGILVVIFIPLLPLCFKLLKRNGLHCDNYTQFGLGLMIAGSAYGILAFALFLQLLDHTLLSISWIFAFYLLLTIGAVMVGPVGLALIAALAPQSARSLTMGIWKGSKSFSSWCIGLISAHFIVNADDRVGYIKGFHDLFKNMTYCGILGGIFMVILFSYLYRK